MATPLLSIESGSPLETTDVSHLQLWQDSVNARANAPALILRHQSSQDFVWVGSQHNDLSYLQCTYADLDRGARRLTTQLNRLTQLKRQSIATLINNQAEWALFFWASPQEVQSSLVNNWSVLNEILSDEPTSPDTPDVLKANDTILVLFTSGTTSLPKLATYQVSCASTRRAYHPTLRSVAVENDNGEILLMSVRATTNWFQAALTSGWQVETKEELGTLHLDDPELDNASPPGPLVRIHIAKVRSDGTSGLVLIGSHAINDMTMTKLWLEDVVSILSGEGSLAPHAMFRDYATAFSQHREGAEATKGVEYWTNKLAGIAGTPEEFLWPQQRAPEWFMGVDVGWSRWNHIPARAGERRVSIELKRQAQKSIRRIVKVDDIARLKSEHNVPVFMLVKSATALLNASQTGGKEAIFGTIYAARTWPFSADYSLKECDVYNSNPLDITGCTTEYVLDRVLVGQARNVVKFMQTVTIDEEKTSSFAHTPFYRIVDSLRDHLSVNDSRTFSEPERDAESIRSVIRRQSFNWLAQPSNAHHPKGLKLIVMQTRMDNGLTITGVLAEDKRSVALSFTWDAEHFSLREANTALNQLANRIELLWKEENWGLAVADLMRS